MCARFVLFRKRIIFTVYLCPMQSAQALKEVKFKTKDKFLLAHACVVL